MAWGMSSIKRRQLNKQSELQQDPAFKTRRKGKGRDETQGLEEAAAAVAVWGWTG